METCDDSQVQLGDFSYPGIVNLLLPAYGPRAGDVARSLGSMGSRYYFRLNGLGSDPPSTLTGMRDKELEAQLDNRLADAAYIPVRESHVEPSGTQVVADRFAAEAVLHGAHLYARGVRECH